VRTGGCAATQAGDRAKIHAGSAEISIAPEPTVPARTSDPFMRARPSDEHQGSTRILVIVPADLPRGFASEGPDVAEGGPGPFGDAVLPLREIQRRYARWAVAQNGGVKAHAARALGVDIKTLMNLLSE